MISHLQDGHASIEHTKDEQLMRPPLWIDKIEGKFIVVDSDECLPVPIQYLDHPLYLSPHSLLLNKSTFIVFCIRILKLLRK